MNASIKDQDPIAHPADEREDIEAQLRATLRQDLSRALRSRRPLLSHLNADTTWLLSVPVPTLENSPHTKSKKRKRKSELESDFNNGHIGIDATEDEGRRKAYFHILIDPWLKGSQSDVADFFSQQWHAHDSAVQTIAEVEEVIGGIEDLASSDGTSLRSHPDEEASRGTIDAVVVSHEFTDHCHKTTLLDLKAATPVFAAPKAARLIKSWKHFDTVVTLPTNLSKTRDWRSTSVAPLPPWLGIARLGQDKVDLLYYHSAVLITFRSPAEDGEGEDEAEAVIYTPHGITLEDLKPVATAEPRIRTLALLHGLHNINIGPQLNLGAHNGILVQQMTSARHWVATHDEVKRGGGLVSWVLNRKVYTVKDAIDKLIEEKKGDVDESLKSVNFAEVENGESLLLD